MRDTDSTSKQKGARNGGSKTVRANRDNDRSRTTDEVQARNEQAIKTVPKKRSAASRSSAAGSAGATPQSAPQTGISSEQRRAMIAELAYLRAERRGFADGDPITDWLEGEKEIDRVLTQRAD